jgi:signal transduction histidine kinase
MAGAIFIPSSFLHFCVTLIDERKKYLNVVIFWYFVSLFFLVLDFFPIYIPDVRPRMIFPYWPTAGPAYTPFLAMFIGVTIYSHILLFKHYRKLSGVKRNQIKYVFLGTAIGFIGGSTNYPLWYDINILPIGNAFVTIYVVTIAYSIIKYRLMDIKTAIIRAAIFTFVYILVLGIPFGLAEWYRPWLISIFDQNWFRLPMFVLLGLATLGPFIYLYLQRRAENALLKDQRRYQTALTELSERMTRIRDIDKLLEDIVSTITTVKVSFIAIYLKDEEYRSFKLKAHHPKDLKSSLQEMISIDDPIISLLSKEKRPLLSEEIGPLKNLGPNSGLILPCFIKEDLLCFIVLGTKPNNQIYTQDDIMVFEMLSYSTALAIENSIFWEEIQKRQREERIEEMDIYAYSLAHEIQNPMQIIRGTYYRLKENLEKPELTEEKKKSLLNSLKFMFEATQRVIDMVEAIRSFGSKTSGELIPLEIKDIVDSFIILKTAEFKAEKVIVTKEIPSEPIFILGVKNEIITIMINFMKNAIQAMELSKEKKIDIKVTTINSDFVRISFTDTGHGVPKEKINIIFAPLVTTKASSVGTGMGLYNAVKLAKYNKGKVWAESEGKGKGATFILEMPIAKDIKKEDLLKKEDPRSNWKF